jgi:beta-glucosidase
MKELGIKAYRFSLSWSRIFPDGVGEVNPDGVRFYNELIDALLENGIEPYITLYHWDLPQALYLRGGWMNGESVAWFAQYAAKVAQLFSDRVKFFITFNEPQCFIGSSCYAGGQAPGLKMGLRAVFQMAHNVLKAHGAAVKAMRAAAVRPIQLGIAPTCSAHYPQTETPADMEAARQMLFACPPLTAPNVLWSVSWWSDPVFFGRYPEDGLQMYKDYLPEITQEEMALISQPIDFYGQNIYNGKIVRANEQGEPEFVDRKPGYAVTSLGWPVTPEALRWGPRFLYERYGKPVFITENGMSAHDSVSLDGQVHDPNRIDFLHRYLLALEKATDDGADIGGYFLWSFMDNFEWAKGYTERFGIVYIDYETQERIPKDSAYWYRDWIKAHQ